MDDKMQPAPRLGHVWNIEELQKTNAAFVTLIGTYLGDEATSPPSKVPALGTLSLHYWRLREGEDNQRPHKEDEAYFVIAGRGTLTVEGRKHPLTKGDLIFVPRCAEHRFHDFHEEGLDLLVIFGPNFSG